MNIVPGPKTSPGLIYFCLRIVERLARYCDSKQINSVFEFRPFNILFGVSRREKFVKLKYDGIKTFLGISVKTTVVLWKQGKMTQYVRSAVSTAVMPEGEIIWGCPVLITPYHLLEFCLKTVMVLFFYFFILFLLPVQCTSVQLFSFFLLKTEVGFAFKF